MRSIIAGLLASTVLATAAYSQTAPLPAPATAPGTVQMMKHSGEWRASKLIGLSIYNPQNEKIGDINEIIVDPTGKVTGVVVGVGGFLGMGEHDVLVNLEQIKFVNEPIRSAGTSTGVAVGTTAANRPARVANEKWYPDHAVINASKDQLKALPQFKYSS